MVGDWLLSPRFLGMVDMVSTWVGAVRSWRLTGLVLVGPIGVDLELLVEMFVFQQVLAGKQLECDWCLWWG